MSNHVKFYPAIILYVFNTLVALVVSFGFHLSQVQVSWATTIATAILAIITAAMTRPVPVSVIAGAFGTIAVGVGAFGLKLSPAQITELTAVVSLIVAYFTHQNVSPIAGSPTGTPLGGSVRTV